MLGAFYIKATCIGSILIFKNTFVVGKHLHFLYF